MSIAVQEDDQTSAANKLKSGLVEILHGETVMLNGEFASEHVVLVEVEKDTDQLVDKGYFYAFVFHPPAQRNMTARTSVELLDGRTATETVPVEVSAGTTEIDWQNPELPGRGTEEFEEDPMTLPYRDKE